MSQHTPGPWTVLSNENGITVHRDLTGTLLATVAALKGASAANARLIAAAPMLLEALEMLMPQLDGFYYGYDTARAAIRAAKGESNG